MPSDNIENETKAIKNANGDIEQLFIVVKLKEFDQNSKQLRKTSSGPDTICANFLKNFLTMLKSLPVLS